MLSKPHAKPKPVTRRTVKATRRGVKAANIAAVWEAAFERDGLCRVVHFLLDAGFYR
jgi:hypothetical protein